MSADQIRFSKEHEWIIVKEGIATMGISDFAQKQLGDIVSVELPKVGAAFSQMQPMAIIQSRLPLIYIALLAEKLYRSMKNCWNILN